MDDEESIHADDAEEIEAVYQQTKKDKKKGKKPANGNDEPATPKKKGGRRKKKTATFLPQPPPSSMFDEDDEDAATDAATDADDDFFKFFSGGDNAGGGVPEVDAETIARIVNKCYMIHEYYNAFPDLKTKKRWTVDKCTEEACDKELERIRHTRNMQGARAAFNGAFIGCFGMLETATHDWGFNPMELEIRGIRSATAKNLHMFESELTEAYIELASRFSTGWQWRLAYKCFQFTMTYSAMQKDPEFSAKVQAARKKAEEAFKNGNIPVPPE